MNTPVAAEMTPVAAPTIGPSHGSCAFCTLICSDPRAVSA